MLPTCIDIMLALTAKYYMLPSCTRSWLSSIGCRPKFLCIFMHIFTQRDCSLLPVFWENESFTVVTNNGYFVWGWLSKNIIILMLCLALFSYNANLYCTTIAQCINSKKNQTLKNWNHLYKRAAKKRYSKCLNLKMLYVVYYVV